jgi:phosphoesterase RecJ-like protein
MSDPAFDAIVELVRRSQRFVVTSHARPDGDSIGSQLAFAYALRALGKDVTIVNRDPAPPTLMVFPGVSGIQIADRIDGEFDAAVVMECGDLGRPGVAGLDRYPVVNIDHHPGNTGYGTINWYDESAAACAEMVYDLVLALGVPITPEIATHVYVAILTDTGSFHYSNISPRTFETSARLLEAGVDPVAVSRAVYDSNSIGRLRIFGAVLNAMQVAPSGQLAVLYLDQAMAQAAGGSYDDTEGLVNEPLTVKDILASVFFKANDGGSYRVSLRSKGTVDVGSVAKRYGGGGHKNAAGCTVSGPLDERMREIGALVQQAIDGRPADR